MLILQCQQIAMSNDGCRNHMHNPFANESDDLGASMHIHELELVLFKFVFLPHDQLANVVHDSITLESLLHKRIMLTNTTKLCHELHEMPAGPVHRQNYDLCSKARRSFCIHLFINVVTCGGSTTMVTETAQTLFLPPSLKSQPQKARRCHQYPYHGHSCSSLSQNHLRCPVVWYSASLKPK